MLWAFSRKTIGDIETNREDFKCLVSLHIILAVAPFMGAWIETLFVLMHFT